MTDNIFKSWIALFFYDPSHAIFDLKAKTYRPGNMCVMCIICIMFLNCPYYKYVDIYEKRYHT